MCLSEREVVESVDSRRGIGVEQTRAHLLLGLFGCWPTSKHKVLPAEHLPSWAPCRLKRTKTWAVWVSCHDIACVSLHLITHVLTENTDPSFCMECSAFYNDKATIIQEARVFNESPISPRRCRSLLTRIIFLLYSGETFSTQEATTLFFGVTKLFQHKDSALRQMVYLVIKELSGIAEDVIMVTSSIMKDMQPNLEVVYRPNAIRALARIIDVSCKSQQLKCPLC